MDRRNRSQLGLGIILLLLAAWLVATKLNPELAQILNMTFTWPMWVIIAGGIVLLIGLLLGAPGMAVPASITAGIGGILYYQNATNDWGSWAYMWALIPGFVGIGVILSGLLGGNFRQEALHGLRLLATSAVLFLVFAAIFGGLDIFGQYKEFAVAGLLFLFGLLLILRGLFRQRRKE